jgi:pantetheine-phosphate adenylyltransferase
MIKAVYPGSFDPLSNGHLDIINRAAKILDELHIIVSVNKSKKNTFTIEERVNMIKLVTKHLPNVYVTSYEGLVVNYCKENGIKILIRGLRNYQDYEAEFSLYQFNRDIDSNVETMLMMPTNKHIFVSSSAIKELVSFDADISNYVPAEIKDMIIRKYKNNK